LNLAVFSEDEGYRLETGGSMQMSMRKLNSHTILQKYPLWCCCHVMYKLLYPSIRVRTAPPVSVRVRVNVSFSYSVTLLHILVYPETGTHVCSIPPLAPPIGSGKLLLCPRVRRAIGSGQRILYRLGSGLWLVPVLVLRWSRFLNDSQDET